MEKTTTRKIIGGLLIMSIIASIAAVLVSADTDTEDDTDNLQTQMMNRDFMCRKQSFNSDLTDEQQAEIEALITSLNEQGATREEIRDAVNAKLDEWGILDERLDSAIENTEQRLTILNREKELRDQGYSWEDINEIIQEEFDIEFPVGMGYNMKERHGFHGRLNGGFNNNLPSEEDNDDET